MKLKCLSEVELEPLEWVWKDVIPQGTLTLLTGEPGVGKSLLTLEIAALLTMGYRGPKNREEGEPAAVILFAGEDDLAVSIRPRLAAAGAYEELVYAIRGVEYMDLDTLRVKPWSFRVNRDLPILENYLRWLRADGPAVRLIVIDPIDGFLDQSDGQRDAETRETVSKLSELAARSGVAILLVSHPMKSGIGKRGSWSPTTRAFAEAARSVWMLVHDKNDSVRRMLLPVKTNLCETPLGLAFTIQDNAIYWEDDAVPLTAEQFLAQSTARTQTSLLEQDQSELSRVASWLDRRLRSGRILSVTIREEAEANEMSEATLRRAFSRLGCQSGKEKKAFGQWYWRLPAPEEVPSTTPTGEVTQSCST